MGQNNILDDSVLVLNRHLLAVQVVTVRDAIIALVANRARVIDENYRQFDFYQWEDHSTEALILTTEADKYTGFIHSPKHTIAAPQVIVAHECEYLQTAARNIKYSRRNVFQRDGNICQYCEQRPKKEELTIDHVIPRSLGGKNTWTNVVTCCLSCNARKGNRTLEELGWKLKSKPTAPKWKSHVGKPFSQAKKLYWEKFL